MSATVGQLFHAYEHRDQQIVKALRESVHLLDQIATTPLVYEPARKSALKELAKSLDKIADTLEKDPCS